MNLYKVTLTAPHRATRHDRACGIDGRQAEGRAITKWYRDYMFLGYVPDELRGVAATATLIEITTHDDE